MRRILPTLPALEAFEAVARLGHVTKAADELGRTQSAVSRQIANLESFARRPLFVRDKKRLILNDAGDFFFEAVSRGSEEHTSELQSLMRISYAVICLKKKQE